MAKENTNIWYQTMLRIKLPLLKDYFKRSNRLLRNLFIVAIWPWSSWPWSCQISRTPFDLCISLDVEDSWSQVFSWDSGSFFFNLQEFPRGVWWGSNEVRSLKTDTWQSRTEHQNDNPWFTLPQCYLSITYMVKLTLTPYKIHTIPWQVLSRE